MQVFKRSELTADMLKQWQREAQQEIILETAQTIFDLSMAISEKLEGKVDMKENGRVYVDGCPAGCWRKQGDMFIHYMPGAPNAKIVRGPWK